MNSDLALQFGPMFDLSGKRALVTGGAVGMGRAAARVLARAGAEVVLVDDEERLAGLAPLDKGIIARPCDVSEEQSVVALVELIIAEVGEIDILINAAVINHNKPLLEISGEEWDRVQAVNLKAAFLFTRELAPSMQRQGGGRIINITTMGSVHPVLHGNGAYSASRAGLNQFTRNCALDFAADRITANAILPGAIVTEAIPSGLRPSGPGADSARHLSGYGKPEDVEGLILLLAGPSGRYITGQAIAVDGGFLVS